MPASASSLFASERGDPVVALVSFWSRWVLRIIQIVGTIDGRAFFGLLAEAFGFQIFDFGLGFIKFLLQLLISLDRIRMTTLPIADIATKLLDFTTELGHLRLQIDNEASKSAS